jgi:hypothetical protein
MSDRSSGASNADVSSGSERDEDTSLGPDDLRASGSSSISSNVYVNDVYVNDVDWSEGRCRGCAGSGPLGTPCTECRSTRAVKFQYDAYLGVCGNCGRVGELGAWCGCVGRVEHEFRPYGS